MLSPSESLLSALICPDDGAPLQGESDQSLRCGHCLRWFPSEGGVLCMLPKAPVGDAALAGEVRAEQLQRDLEAERYDQLLGLRLLSHWELPATLKPLEITPQDRVLEVGCGTGRFTVQIARDCRELIAIDHSLESLRILQRKLSSLDRIRVLLIQGDATRLPIRTGWANSALSCQMLEHLPGQAMRQAALAELARSLEDGGRMAISAYWHTPGLRWLLQREGKHSGAIYFHRFSKPEFRQLLEQDFQVLSITGKLVYLLLAQLRRK